MFKNLTLILLSVAALSCESSINPSGIEDGQEFFPLKTGDIRIYQVNEVNHNIDGTIEDLNYFIKEEIVESFISASDSTYVIYRYQRENDMMEWEFVETRQARITDHQAIIFEGNIPYLKLTFPIVAGKMWDGNLLNDQEEDLYVMDSIYSAYNSELQFDSTLTVIQNDNQDFIVELDRRFEIYGYNVGQVYKEEILYTYCTEDNCLGQQQIETGRKLTETLVEYAL